MRSFTHEAYGSATLQLAVEGQGGTGKDTRLRSDCGQNLNAINNPLGSYRRTSVLRPPGAAPAKRGSIMGALKGPHEVARIAVANPPADLLNRQVRFDQETLRLHHAALGDPLLHRPPRLTSDNRGEVTRREAHRPRHVLERDALAVVLLDKAEDLGEQGLILEPEVAHDVHCQPPHAHKQERQVRQDRLPVAVPPLAKLEVKSRQALGP